MRNINNHHWQIAFALLQNSHHLYSPLLHILDYLDSRRNILHCQFFLLCV